MGKFSWDLSEKAGSGCCSAHDPLVPGTMNVYCALHVILTIIKVLHGNLLGNITVKLPTNNIQSEIISIPGQTYHRT